MRLTAAILAAGSGSRLGGVPKQFRLLAGRPLWHYSYETARAVCAKFDAEILLVLPPDAEEAFQTAEKLAPDARLIAGGTSRGESALKALQAARGELIALHDAARPFASPDLWEKLVEAAGNGRAAVPVLPVPDSLKRRAGSGWEPVSREGLFLTQTPQVFPRDELLRALTGRADAAGLTDEAQAWLEAGKELAAVDGEEKNAKITRPGDWELACRLAGPEIRTGIGYDVHPLTPDRPLVLAGVTVPSPLGLAGHSDADIISHVAADAVLSAAGLPDIGTLYPSSDEQYAGCRSMDLLADAVSRAEQAGWSVQFVSLVVTAQVPKLAPYGPAIRQALEKVLGDGKISVTFKSGESVGPVGEAQAMAAWAAATVARSGLRLPARPL
ncbi:MULTISPECIES: 2-C-methyl-D-erythritol 2,4-cyclodiphosphate synthase [Jonquetella]|uniref:2-C-methyl-D-erythritol 2,4-cyclodiphosphate synthase n=1 Tax=Jonquetella anthropi DSM 22815 TaxID=885272 RepID=H0UJ58_9BACT|nr:MULTISPECIES: 2-C-methyl-D-erythritol 2,4-cyclodiphosphate synthase [Jonquetella]EEX48768.1 2-C-methyl-D-erythritol 2,4-cyclodiphosphate synthase [Jonquetella anthropi E3_33 E1]EHM12791.1 2-C-methyl-D-erythritol 2,4-cyclodiphosphate synthase [Jonquetella anthropi DSM 22815]ERL24077.1 2-C-methyl-D-erythritol 2,4-cyclodiphosphate synthase [Jonquetella sp. BV3C21]